MSELVTVPCNATVDDIQEVLEKDGAVVIEKFSTEQQIDRFMAEMDPYIRAASPDVSFDPEKHGLSASRSIRLSGLLAKAPACGEWIMNPILIGLAEAILTCEATSWLGERRETFRSSPQLTDTQLLSLLPGAAKQDLHRDDISYFRSHPGPEYQILALVAATRFTAANGGTQLVLGSHKWDDDRPPRSEEVVVAEMNQGSCLIWLGSLYHGGGANTTASEERTGVAFVYGQGHLRQVENMYLNVPVEKVRQFPIQLQRLMGYSMGGPFLGYWENQDPLGYVNRSQAAS